MFRRKRICEALLAALLALEGQRAFALTYRCSSDIVTTASSNSTSIGTIVGIFYNNQTCASIPMGLGSLVLDNTGHSEEIPSTSTALYFENQGSGSYSYLSMTGGAPELNMNGNSIAYGSDNTTGASSYTGDTVVELDSTWNVGTVSNTIIQAGVLLEPTSSVNLGGSVVLGDPANEIVITSEIAPTLEFGFGLSSYSGPIYVADNYGEIDGLPGGVYTLSGNIEPTSSGQTGVEFSNTQGYGAVFDLYGLVTNQLPVIIDAGVTLVPEGGNNLLLPSAVSVYGTLSVPAGINTGVTTLEGNGGVTVGLAGSVVIENGGTTFSGIIGGAGGLQVVQGTQTLSGANTYTGDTTIDAYSGLDLTGTGSLADSRVNTPGGLFISGVTNGTSIRSLTGSSAGIVVLGSQTLTLTNAADTFPGVISGTGGLTVAAGTESLTNANTYTGATTIAAGATLQLGSGGSIANSPVTANGNFDISPTPAGATIPSLAGASGGVVNLGGQTLTLSNPVDTFNGVLQGTNGALAVLAGTETLTGASTYTGVTTIYAGAGIDLSGNGSLANSLVVTPGGLFIGGSTNGATVGSLSGTSQGIVVLGSKTLTLDQAGATFAGVISGVGGGLDISAGTEMLTGVNTYTGATTVASGATLDLSGSGSVSSSAVTANGVVDISATSAGTSFQSLAGGGSGVVNLGTQNLSLSNAVDTFNGSITSTGGSLSVTGGTETLAGNNGYTGTTTISGGATLALSGTGSIASSSSVNDSGTLDISGVFSRATIVSLSGPTTGVVNLGGSNLALSQASGSFGGTLQGSNGSLSIDGGTETLTGTSNYTGATTVANGATLALGGAGAVASSSDIVVNGILDLSAATTGESITTLSGASTGEVLIGNQTLTLSNASTTFSGSIAGTGVTQISSGATLALVGAGSLASSALNDNGSFDLSATTSGASVASLDGSTTGVVLLGARSLTLSNASGSFSGSIQGAGGSLDLSSGTQVLDGANSYTGTTTVQSGATLILGSSGSLAATPVVADGTLDASGGAAALTLPTLSGSGQVLLGANALTLTQASGDFTGTISGTASVSLTSGSETFAGANTYTGGTYVRGGRLSLADGASLNSDLQVLQGATTAIARNAFVQGSVVNTGTLAVGSTAMPAGTLSVSGSYVQGSSSTLSLAIAPTTNAQLSVQGAQLSLGGQLLVQAAPGNYLRNTYLLVSAPSTTTLSGSFSSLQVLGLSSSAYTYTLQYLPDPQVLLTVQALAPFASGGGSGATLNTRRTGQALDTVAASATGALYTSLLGLFDASSISAALDSQDGQLYPQTPGLLLQGTQHSWGRLFERMNLGRQRDARPDDDAFAWIGGSRSRLLGDGNADGAVARSTSLTLGRQVSHGFCTAGVALGTQDMGATRNLIGDGLSARLYRVGAFGGYVNGTMRLASVLGYSWGRVLYGSAERGVRIVSWETRLGQDLPVSPDNVLTPLLGVSAQHLRLDSTTEPNPLLGLSVPAQSANGVSALAALRDVQSWQWGQVHGAFSSSLGVRHWIHTPPSAMTMHFNAIPGAPFTILAVATPRNVVEAGIGLHAHLRKNLSAVLSYQGDYGRGLVSNEVQVHLNLNF